jgi:hypothetical protein
MIAVASGYINTALQVEESPNEKSLKEGIGSLDELLGCNGQLAAWWRGLPSG